MHTRTYIQTYICFVVSVLLLSPASYFLPRSFVDTHPRSLAFTLSLSLSHFYSLWPQVPGPRGPAGRRPASPWRARPGRAPSRRRRLARARRPAPRRRRRRRPARVGAPRGGRRRAHRPPPAAAAGEAGGAAGGGGAVPGGRVVRSAPACTSRAARDAARAKPRPRRIGALQPQRANASEPRCTSGPGGFRKFRMSTRRHARAEYPLYQRAAP
jgi:hypothetical protein